MIEGDYARRRATARYLGKGTARTLLSIDFAPVFHRVREPAQ